MQNKRPDPYPSGHCNDCAACYRRYVALSSNGIEVESLSQRIVDEYKAKAANGNYHPDRIQRVTSLGLL